LALWLALAINAGMFAVEGVAGLLSGSASLQADSLDFLGDSSIRTIDARTNPIPSSIDPAYTLDGGESRTNLGSAYARRHCNPQLLPEAGVVLCEFYKELRLKHGSDEGMPITTRQLESLLRLSEARAKIELAEFVTRDHALDVVVRDGLDDAPGEAGENSAGGSVTGTAGAAVSRAASSALNLRSR
jgi:hypothetical protein